VIEDLHWADTTSDAFFGEIGAMGHAERLRARLAE